jgi:RNA ligase
MDGSLGILFNYKGEWVLATRGSFTSDQSVKGTELLQKYDYNRLTT